LQTLSIFQATRAHLRSLQQIPGGLTSMGF
jgi:hypothetical protein